MGTEELATEPLHRRRRPIPLQTLMKEFAFYEQKADEAESYLPNARTEDNTYETKRTFEEFKAAVDGMRLTSQRINEKLVTDGRITEANRYNKKVNKKYKTVAEIRRLY